jgi:threonine synthase
MPSVSARRLIAQGRIGKEDGPVVLCITGQGMKTQDPLVDRLPRPELIGPRLADFDTLLAGPLAGLA